MNQTKPALLQKTLFIAVPLLAFAAFAFAFRGSYNIKGFSQFTNTMFPLLLVCLGAGVLLVALLQVSEKIPLERMALIAILFFGSIYLFVFPPNTVPDEAVHFSSAYEAANVPLGQQSGDVKTILMRQADTRFYTDYSNFPDQGTYEHFTEQLFQAPPQGAQAQITEAPRITGVPYPYIYAPQAAGIVLARVLHTNPEWLYLLGRIFNLIAYALAIWASIKLTPIGKGIFAITAMFPMMMQLSASLSSDIASIALAYLALAQYLRIAYQPGPTKLRDLILLVGTMALLGPPKVVFLPFLMLAFFLPKKCFAAKKYEIIFRVSIVIIFLALLFSVLWNFIHRGADGTPVITYGEGPFYTISDILENPRFFLATCKRTILMYFEFYLNSMIGAELGWLEIHINKIICETLLALALLAGFRVHKEDPTLNGKRRLMFALLFFLAAFGTAIVMYVSWTPYGSWYIIGIQGRYFLPVFAALLLAALGWYLPVRRWLTDKRLLLAACTLQVPILLMAFTFIASRVPPPPVG